MNMKCGQWSGELKKILNYEFVLLFFVSWGFASRGNSCIYPKFVSGIDTELLRTMNCLGFICCQYGGREICSYCSSWMYIIMSWTFSACPAKEMMIVMHQMWMPLMDTWHSWNWEFLIGFELIDLDDPTPIVVVGSRRLACVIG